MTNDNVLPLLGYGGRRDRNSGFAAGSPTSEARARDEDTSGVTARRQRIVLQALEHAGPVGLTWREMSDAIYAAVGERWHHGQITGAVSNLHKAERVARLTESRNRCRVYVLPEFTNGRDTEKQGGKSSEPALIDQMAEVLANFAVLDSKIGYQCPAHIDVAPDPMCALCDGALVLRKWKAGKRR